MLELTITRTANAGVWLEMDGVSFLLDGVCEPLSPYLGTAKTVRNRLMQSPPDVLAFTHKHKDHYDDSYAQFYKQKTLRPVYGPESLPFYEIGNKVKLTLIDTRHIGKTDIPHVSYIIEGSACVWFMGDASPLVLRRLADFPKPDVLIVPFAYATTPSAWQSAKETGAREIVLLHMPLVEKDSEGIWESVRHTTQNAEHFHIPNMGESLRFLL